MNKKIRMQSLLGASLMTLSLAWTGCKGNDAGLASATPAGGSQQQAGGAQRYADEGGASGNLAPLVTANQANPPTRTGQQQSAPAPQGQIAQRSENYAGAPQQQQQPQQQGNAQYPPDQQYPATQQQQEYPQAQYNGPAEQSPDYSQDYGQVQPEEQPAYYSTQPPPPLPNYDQPPVPGPNYVWTPGYWAWSSGYYWVPGAWTQAPYVGSLWTPGYWAYDNNRYGWRNGYWGPYVGFYGGVNYGCGYVGSGYFGGFWRQGGFYYNRNCNNVASISNNFVYQSNVNVINRSPVSFNGGRGGLNYRASAAERAALQQPRLAPLAVQQTLVRNAQGNQANFFKNNNGRPAAPVATQPLVQAGAPQPLQAPRFVPSVARALGNPQAAVPTRSAAGSQRPVAPSQARINALNNQPQVKPQAQMQHPAVATAPVQRSAAANPAAVTPQHSAAAVPQRVAPAMQRVVPQQRKAPLAPPPQHPVAPQTQHAITPPVRHALPPPVRHAVAPQIQHPVTPPVQHTVAPQIQHVITPPVQHPVAPPVQHPVPPQLQHAVTPPVQRQAPPPMQRQVTPPVQHQVAPPVQHAEAPHPVAPPRPAPPIQHAAPPPPRPAPQAAPPPRPAPVQRAAPAAPKKDDKK